MASFKVLKLSKLVMGTELYDSIVKAPRSVIGLELGMRFATTKVGNEVGRVKVDIEVDCSMCWN